MKILVIGGTGSIGFELAKALARDHEVVIMARGEQGHYLARREAPHIRTVIDDVTTMRLHDYVGYDLVYYCAAMKHVGFCEENPEMAYRVNCQGAVMATAIAPTILLSTDKAVAPTSVMGWSKLLAEKHVLQLGGTVVRLCNVSDTRGNLLETARWCRETGNTLTINDLQAVRYWTSREHAIEVLQLPIKGLLGMAETYWAAGDELTVEQYLRCNCPEALEDYKQGKPREQEKQRELLCWTNEERHATELSAAFRVPARYTLEAIREMEGKWKCA